MKTIIIHGPNGAWGSQAIRDLLHTSGTQYTSFFFLCVWKKKKSFLYTLILTVFYLYFFSANYSVCLLFWFEFLFIVINYYYYYYYYHYFVLVNNWFKPKKIRLNNFTFGLIINYLFVVQKLTLYPFDICSIRALALKNANVISKGFLTFYESKVSASKNCKHHYCKIFYNSATVQF